MKTPEDRIPKYIKEMSLSEFLEQLDEYGVGRYMNHECAVRIRKLTAALEKAEKTTADIRSILKPVLHMLGIDHYGQIKSTIYALQFQLMECRGEAICPNCGDGYETLKEANGCCR